MPKFQSFTFPRAEFGVQAPAWLHFIHQVNRIAPETFGSPLSQDGNTETYPTATVSFRENSVVITPLDYETLVLFGRVDDAQSKS